MCGGPLSLARMIAHGACALAAHERRRWATTPCDGHRLAAERCVLVAYRGTRWTLPPRDGCARGRAGRAMLCRSQHNSAQDVAPLDAGRRQLVAKVGLHVRALAAQYKAWWPDDGRGLRVLPPRMFVVAPPPPAAAPAMLRRVSGDVVTAGLISSRVWFGPVPGSPRSFGPVCDAGFGFDRF
ncbi:hypothetical protein F511_41838 [Dorcoceras hygrometricum]|uniref:Uncharacterized protein n=1 Tax=Dorcoceras hygrometricum TaxID=472368 RepID=A0A2Z7B925_9LAMI|nr:hypothetical protein F511_41838 [Dorcoceras hygrometricum]